MGRYKYFTVFVLTIISFLGLSLLFSTAGETLFILEIYFMMLLLIVAGIAFLAIGRGLRLGWALLTVLFLTFLFDTLFLYTYGAPGKTTFYITLLAGALGFLVSVHHATSSKRKAEKHSIKIEDYSYSPEVKPSIEPFKKEAEEEKRPARTTTRKKAKTAKKPARKSAAKRAKKKTGATRKKTRRNRAKKAA